MALIKVNTRGQSSDFSTEVGATKNLIINGNMLIAQRGTGASTTNNGFAVDRFKNISNTTDFSAQQSSVVPSGQEFTKSLHITPTSTKAHGGSDYFFTSHYVEGYNIVSLGYGTSGAKTITISFWVRSSKTGTYSLGMKNSVANRSIQNEYTISVADTWEKKTIVVPGETTGSWPVDNTRGIAFDFCLAGQAAATSSVNTWLTNNSNMSSNQVNFFDNTNNNFYLTGVQVEVGATASDFEHRLFTEELALCQRYYYQCGFLVSTHYGGGSGCAYAFNGSESGGANNFPVTMRSSPTVRIKDTAGNIGGVHRAAVGNITSGVTINWASNADANTKGIGGVVKSNAWSTGNVLVFGYEADAEL
jgi:hypothetical protein